MANLHRHLSLHSVGNLNRAGRRVLLGHHPARGHLTRTGALLRHANLVRLGARLLLLHVSANLHVLGLRLRLADRHGIFVRHLLHLWLHARVLDFAGLDLRLPHVAHDGTGLYATAAAVGIRLRYLFPASVVFANGARLHNRHHAAHLARALARFGVRNHDGTLPSLGGHDRLADGEADFASPGFIGGHGVLVFDGVLFCNRAADRIGVLLLFGFALDHVDGAVVGDHLRDHHRAFDGLVGGFTIRRATPTAATPTAASPVAPARIRALAKRRRQDRGEQKTKTM